MRYLTASLQRRVARLERAAKVTAAVRRRWPDLFTGNIPAAGDALPAKTAQSPPSEPVPAATAHGENVPTQAPARARRSRGFPSRTAVNRLRSQLRGLIRRQNHMPLDVPLILLWADRFHAKYGGWPSAASGLIDDNPRDTWAAINAALYCGNRGLPGGSSLPLLLAQERGHTPRWTRWHRKTMGLDVNYVELDDSQGTDP